MHTSNWSPPSLVPAFMSGLDREMSFLQRSLNLAVTLGHHLLEGWQVVSWSMLCRIFDFTVQAGAADEHIQREFPELGDSAKLIHGMDLNLVTRLTAHCLHHTGTAVCRCTQTSWWIIPDWSPPTPRDRHKHQSILRGCDVSFPAIDVGAPPPSMWAGSTSPPSRPPRCRRSSRTGRPGPSTGSYSSASATQGGSGTYVLLHCPSSPGSSRGTCLSAWSLLSCLPSLSCRSGSSCGNTWFYIPL